MTYREFEEAVTGPLGYKSVGAFADQTKLLARATATKWKKEGKIPSQIAAYIELRLDCEHRDQTRAVIQCEKGGKALLNGAPCLFSGELRMHTIDSDNFAPQYRAGDIVLGEAYTAEQGFSDGFWLFDTKEGRKFGVLQCLFHGKYRLYGNAAYSESYSILFGIEHTRKEMVPVAKVQYHVRKVG